MSAMLNFKWFCLIGLEICLTTMGATTRVFPGEENHYNGNSHGRITSEPQNFELELGQTVQFPCKLENPDEVAVIWQYGDNILSAGDIIVSDDKRLKLSQQDLVITNITAGDAGEYKCKTTTSRSYEVIHTLRIYQLPTASVKSPWRVVRIGDPVSLNCEATGYPEPTVTWQKLVGENIPVGETITEGTTLTIRRVTRDHTGTYECIASNKAGAVWTTVKLVVEHAPEIQVGRRTESTEVGHSVELACIVCAEPRAEVTWGKNGVALNNNQSDKYAPYSGQNGYRILHIRNVQENDFDNYSCVAHNKLGQAIKEVSLVKAVPIQSLAEEKFSSKAKSNRTVVLAFEFAVNIAEGLIRFKKNDSAWQEVLAPPMKDRENGYDITIKNQLVIEVSASKSTQE